MQVFAEKAKKLLLEDKVVAVLGATPPLVVSRCCRCSNGTMAFCSIPHFMKHKSALKTAFIPALCPTSSSTISFRGS